MDVAFTRISYWIWGRKDGEGLDPSTRYSQVFQSGFIDPDHPADERRMQSNLGRLRRKWQSREERRVDKEYDIVIVPSDGECMSGSESDGSDWSVGWSEPHDPAFSNASEAENSFAVLVPCYRRHTDGHAEGSKSPPFGIVPSSDAPLDDKRRIEGWLSSF